ncbi:hypothetical protein CHLRE_11g480116v5 [Chlamydomonas reinhardtii]|uniref:Uncharacterized protein n=1 Tax=Chlamydomonas reinhardtii TaxID=3055 RepID=A0A2K3D8N6_CHLRE|nr:uncharacterized protein CHLRE_11g480116v5 [Chlamydomonas reinhardtii]PNW76886.1 hypothetical protein CHLRE_11g480116v5 [Chlamydomonas reinhardtii]
MGMAMGAHPEDSLGVCARSYLWLVPAGSGAMPASAPWRVLWECENVRRAQTSLLTALDSCIGLIARWQIH